MCWQSLISMMHAMIGQEIGWYYPCVLHTQILEACICFISLSTFVLVQNRCWLVLHIRSWFFHLRLFCNKLFSTVLLMSSNVVSITSTDNSAFGLQSTKTLCSQYSLSWRKFYAILFSHRHLHAFWLRIRILHYFGPPPPFYICGSRSRV